MPSPETPMTAEQAKDALAELEAEYADALDTIKEHYAEKTREERKAVRAECARRTKGLRKYIKWLAEEKKVGE